MGWTKQKWINIMTAYLDMHYLPHQESLLTVFLWSFHNWTHTFASFHTFASNWIWNTLHISVMSNSKNTKETLVMFGVSNEYWIEKNTQFCSIVDTILVCQSQARSCHAWVKLALHCGRNQFKVVDLLASRVLLLHQIWIVNYYVK